MFLSLVLKWQILAHKSHTSFDKTHSNLTLKSMDGANRKKKRKRIQTQTKSRIYVYGFGQTIFFTHI